MYKEGVVYVYNRYYSDIKKNEIMPFAATWMDLEIMLLSEVSQKEKDKYHIISLICGIENRTQMNMSAKQKQTHRYRKQSFGYQGESGGKIGSFGIAEANYSTQDGQTTKTYCIAQETIFNILR